MDKGKIFEKLLRLAVKNNIAVHFAPLKASYGRLKGGRLALLEGMNIDDINYNIAHELARSYLHYDKGDTINGNKHDEYEEQADRAAKMLLDMAAVGESAT